MKKNTLPRLLLGLLTGAVLVGIGHYQNIPWNTMAVIFAVSLLYGVYIAYSSRKLRTLPLLDNLEKELERFSENDRVNLHTAKELIEAHRDFWRWDAIEPIEQLKLGEIIESEGGHHG